MRVQVLLTGIARRVKMLTCYETNYNIITLCILPCPHAPIDHYNIQVLSILFLKRFLLLNITIIIRFQIGKVIIFR